MLAFGTPTKHSMPKMGTETVRALLGEILTPDAIKALMTSGPADIATRPPAK